MRVLCTSETWNLLPHRGVPPHVPPALRLLLLLLSLQVLADLALLLWGDPSGSPAEGHVEFAALAVDVAVLGLLYRATEFTRLALRAAAAIGMVVDAWLLLGVLLAWSVSRSPGAEHRFAIATSVGLVLASAFTWWVLGRADVKSWIFSRWLRRVT